MKNQIREARIQKKRHNKSKSITKTEKYLRMLTVVLAIAVVGVLAFATANLIVIKGAEDYIVTAEQAEEFDADCIVVLGCRVMADGEPSLMLEHRLMVGIELYNAGAAPKLLMSGDHGSESYDEVYTMKKYALDVGIDTDDIFCDHAGFSTYDTMYRAKEVFGCKKIIVVTQEFHLSRAVYIAKSLGLEVCGVACDRAEYEKALSNNKREALARAKAVVSCIFKPKPKFLGDVIPITGNGSITD